MLILYLFLWSAIYCMQQKPQIDQSKSSHLFNSNQLQMACQQGNSSEILDILAQNPTLDPDIPDSTGKTPLNYLVLRNGSLDAIKGLLAANADPLKRCGCLGLNAVDRALLFKRRHILEFLLIDCNLHGRRIEVHPHILKPTATLDPILQQAVVDAQRTGPGFSNTSRYVPNHLPPDRQTGIFSRLRNIVRRIFS